ncbi:MAG: DUF4349 domain-containing protein [Coriobacteriia bacterium]|nr:DUF4349 domain-containing protein [Coriobacteriia bacterium]
MAGTRLRSIIASVLVFALLALTGCSVLGDSENATKDATVESQYTGAPEELPAVDMEVLGGEGVDESVAPRQTSDVAVDAVDRLIIRNKTVRLEVEKVDEAISALEKLASKHDGIITAMQVATDDETPIYRYDEISYSDGAALRGYVTVRVPVDKYEAFLEGVSGIGTVLYQAESADDVTQQHVDMTARLENLRAEEVRLREFFDAANKVEEMLAIERELSRVRGEIESLDAQVKYLERQAAMATVTIDLTEPKPLVRPSGDDWGFGQAITDGFRGAAGVIRVAIALIIATAPLWLLAVIAFFAIRTVLRRRSHRHAKATAPVEPANKA